MKLEIIFTIVGLIINATALLVFLVVGEKVIRKNEDNPNYRRKKTVRWFSIYFAVTALFNLVIMIEYPDLVTHVYFAYLVVLLAIVAMISGYHYIREYKEFTRHSIPVDKVKEMINDANSNHNTDIIECIKNLDLRDEVRAALDRNTQN